MSRAELSEDHTRPACAVRRLAEQGFPAGRRKLHGGFAECSPALPRNRHLSVRFLKVMDEKCSRRLLKNSRMSTRELFGVDIGGATKEHPRKGL